MPAVQIFTTMTVQVLSKQ